MGRRTRKFHPQLVNPPQFQSALHPLENQDLEKPIYMIYMEDIHHNDQSDVCVHIVPTPTTVAEIDELILKYNQDIKNLEDLKRKMRKNCEHNYVREREDGPYGEVFYVCKKCGNIR